MLTAPTLEKLQHLKLDAMAHAWSEQQQHAGGVDDLGIERATDAEVHGNQRDRKRRVLALASVKGGCYRAVTPEWANVGTRRRDHGRGRLRATGSGQPAGAAARHRAPLAGLAAPLEGDVPSAATRCWTSARRTNRPRWPTLAGSRPRSTHWRSVAANVALVEHNAAVAGAIAAALAQPL